MSVLTSLIPQVRRAREEKDSMIDNEDVLELLEEGESLELVESDPMVESDKMWEAAEVINTFLAKYFTKVIDEEEING